jgi:G:T/U-mismatch repair DNA glycosylase
VHTEKHPVESLVPEGAPTEKHPFEPFLPEGAKILFLGSFPPQEKRWCMPFYYPNWINDFWRIMGVIHFGDKDHFCIAGEKRFDEAAIRAFCTREGLAFYDTACEVRRLRDNASDAFLEVVTASDITSLLLKIPNCNTLVTTGQKATEVIAKTFHCPIPPVGGSIDLDIPIPGPGPDRGTSPSSDTSSGRASRPIRFWRMPSTSRAYPLPLEQKADAYLKLFCGE